MSCLGVHFALADDDVAALRALADDAARVAFICNDLEVRYFDGPAQWLAQSDKAWDAMHRALADGLLDYVGGAYPLSHVVLGGEPLYASDDYLISLKTPAQVRDVAAAIAGIGEEDLRTRYFAIDPDEYGVDLDEADFQYTWDGFQEVRALYAAAAAAGRHVLFTADQ